uniref:Uncharacterized protein n=1 Tax=Anguilla anguilla TaxID=7936 RepID=A0A0E9PCT1_ANGAN
MKGPIETLWQVKCGHQSARCIPCCAPKKSFWKRRGKIRHLTC